MAHTRQSRPNSGLGFPVKSLATFQGNPSKLLRLRSEAVRRDHSREFEIVLECSRRGARTTKTFRNHIRRTLPTSLRYWLPWTLSMIQFRIVQETLCSLRCGREHTKNGSSQGQIPVLTVLYVSHSFDSLGRVAQTRRGVEQRDQQDAILLSEKGSRQGQNLALTVLCVPISLEIGRAGTTRLRR